MGSSPMEVLCLCAFSHTISSLGSSFLGMSRSYPFFMVHFDATKKTSVTFPLPWKEFLCLLSLGHSAHWLGHLGLS